jgi:hypothetical protein
MAPPVQIVNTFVNYFNWSHPGDKKGEEKVLESP